MNNSIDHAVTPNSSEPKLPPVIPSAPPSLPNSFPNEGNKGFWDDFIALGPHVSFHGIIDALLKHPARIIYEVMQRSLWRVTFKLIGIATGCFLIYGGVMGSFSGSHQWWLVPIKITAGAFLSALICLPSLYIFSCVAGGQLTLKATAGLLAAMMTLAGLLLVGLAPIAWIFSQATGTIIFMGILHLLFWLVAFRFGLGLLITATRVTGLFSKRVIMFWGILFIIVTMQIATNLRPIIGPFEGFACPDKMFFIEHWGKCMKAGK